MAEQLYSVTGSSLQLETVQDYIDCDIYSNVIEPSVIADSYTCHICTISMPLNSVSAHLSSYIHRMWLTVAELAAERLNRQTSEPIPLFQSLPPDTILCQTCGVLVEDNHTCPTMCTTREKALTRFLNTYQNTVAENIASETLVDDDVARAPNNGLENSTENESDSSEHDLSGVGAEGDVEVGADSEACDEVIDNEINGESSASSNEVPYADDNSHIDTSYIENRHIRNEITKRENVSEEEIQMLKYYEYLYEDQEYTHKILVHNAEYVDIVTPMGDWVRVTEDNYHGFYTVNGKILCRVCRYLVRDKDVHMRTEDHMDRIRCPLTDQNCVRQINLLWNHCVLCNEIIENVEYHVMCNEGHEAALSSALIAPGCLPVPVDGSTVIELVECKLCSETLKKEDMRHHAASSAHKKLLQEKRLPLGDEDPIFSHHHLHKKQGRLRCRVCNIELDEDTEIISNHLDSKNHKDLCVVILLQDRIERVQSKFKCQACAVYLTAENILQHIANEDHVTNIKDLHFGRRPLNNLHVEPKIKLKEVCSYFKVMYYNQDKVYCKVCLVVLKNDRDAMVAHKYEPNHIKQYNYKLKLNKLDRYERLFYCQVCNTTILLLQEVDHWLSVAHKFKLMAIAQYGRLPTTSTAQYPVPNTSFGFLQGSTSTVSDQTVADNKDAVSPVIAQVTERKSNYVYNPIVQPLVKNNLIILEENFMTCKICNVSFSNWITHYDVHVVNFRAFLHINRMCEYNGHYECEMCELIFEPHNVIDHIIEMNHAVESHINQALGSGPVVAYQDPLSKRLIRVIEDGIEVHCTTCDIAIPNSNRVIFDHLKMHRTKEDEYSTRSKDGDIDHLAEYLGLKLNFNE